MKKLLTFLLIMLGIACTNSMIAQTVTDIDGNVYNTILIGSQRWTTENLQTTKLNDGTPIALVTDNNAWYNLTSPAYCWYNNDQAANGATYGAMYNWYVVGTGKLCPTGWHVPGDSEWIELVEYLGGTSVAGLKLKEAGTAHWMMNTGATNESGFTALPGGQRGAYGVFDLLHYAGAWWGSTEYTTLNAGSVSLLYSSGLVQYYNENKLGGWYVRCLEGGSSGIKDHSQSTFQIKVYPNPSQGLVTIENVKGDCAHLQIMDIYGKVVMEKQMTKATQIEILTKGVYLVKISNGSDVSIKKLVIE